MDRLTARQNASGEQGSSKAEASKPPSTGSRSRCFRACSSASTPKPRRRSTRTSWPRNSARSSPRCSTELKINLNRREQFALEKVLVDELLGLGPLEELLADPAISDIMVNGPEQTLRRAQGQARDRADPVPRRGASVPDRPAHRQQGRPPHRPDQLRCATPASRTAAASTSSFRRCRFAAPPSRFVNSPKSRSRST